MRALSPIPLISSYKYEKPLCGIVLASPLLFSADIRGTQNGTFVGHNGVHHSTFNGWTDELETILLNPEVIGELSRPRMILCGHGCVLYWESVLF